MKKIVFTLVLIIIFSISRLLAKNDEKIKQANQIIHQSVEKLIGWDNFDKIENLSFKTVYDYYRTVETKYFADNYSNLKIIVGHEPYVERTILVKNGKITDNNFENIDPLTNYEKTKITCFSKLISGAFTLIRFKDKLQYCNSKKFGLKEYHILETTFFEHKVTFFLETDTFLLGRMIISGTNKSDVSFESMYDFGEAVDYENITIPANWLHNYLGINKVAEGKNTIEDFKTNLQLSANFWNDTHINYGSVKIENGIVSGNVIESYVHKRLQWMMMITNIRWRDLEILKLREHDDMIVIIENKEYPAIYFPNKSNNPARERYKEGLILTGDVAAPYIGLFMLGDEFRDKYENKTAPLLEVKLKNVN